MITHYGMVGDSAVMQEQVYAPISALSKNPPGARTPIIIIGESGTGKELVAKAIHDSGTRRERPFRPLNCAAVTETLLESELFGHERGAYSGANRKYDGLFREAEGGVVFLDEIKEMSPAMQAKLLRALQEYAVRPVGSTQEVPFDAQVIVASSVPLQTDTFRSDLFYRLAVVTIQIPPLRARGTDIDLLASHFGQYFGDNYGKAKFTLSPAALEYAHQYDWPGNVRQLSGVIEGTVALRSGSNKEITRTDLEQKIALTSLQKVSNAGPTSTGVMTLDQMEKAMIIGALERHNGHRTRAAHDLGITDRTIRNKLRQFGLQERFPRPN